MILADDYGRTLTCTGLRDAALTTAAALAECGVAEGSVVSWQLPTTLETMVVMVALSRLGAVQNPILPIWRESEVRLRDRTTRHRRSDRARHVAWLRPRRPRPPAGRRTADVRRGDRSRRADHRPATPACQRSGCAACATDIRRRPALDLLLLGHDRRPEGRSALRPFGDCRLRRCARPRRRIERRRQSRSPFPYRTSAAPPCSRRR